MKQQQKLRLISVLIFTFAAGALLSACGAKGDLVLPPLLPPLEQGVGQEKKVINVSKSEAKK